MKAIWNGQIIAESDITVNIENNHYFPPEAVNKVYLRESSLNTVCPWKGTASYYDIVVDGKANKNAAWYYPDPSKAAQPIKGYIAFWHGVKVEE